VHEPPIVGDGAGRIRNVLSCYLWLVSFVIVMEQRTGSIRREVPKAARRKWPSHVRLTQRQNESMKRTFTFILAALGGVALFGALVYAVLVTAHLSAPAATTVYGLTLRRLWATSVAVLALVGVVIGGLALCRPSSRFGDAYGRLGAIVALVAGLIAVLN